MLQTLFESPNLHVTYPPTASRPVIYIKRERDFPISKVATQFGKKYYSITDR